MSYNLVANFNCWLLRITGAQSKLERREISLVCCILWYIWNQRNEKVFNKSDPNPIVVIEAATRMNNDYWKALTCLLPTSTVSHEVNIKWSPPPLGYLKINVDGAFKPYPTQAALGAICGDDKGVFKWAFTDKIKSLSAFMSKALAFETCALMLALDLEHDKVLLESDSKLLVDCVERQQPDLYDWKSRSIIYDIISLLSSKVGFSLSFSPREGNAAADCLAPEAFKGLCPPGWVSKPSLSLSTILTMEAKKIQHGARDTSVSGLRRGVG